MPKYRHAFLFLMVATLAFSAAGAQTIMGQYGEGSITFDYEQWPFGGLEGTFLADGPVWNEDLTFPEGQTSGCGGGITGAVGDTTRTVAIGAIDNPDGNQDVVLLFVTFPEGPAVGSYPVDLDNMTVGFGWIDDVANLTIPEEGDDYQLWFDSLEAEHKFVSTSGTFEVTAVDADNFTGTFTGLMGEPEDFIILDITGGEFDLTSVVPVPVPAAKAPAQLAAAPNPFNPQTTVKLSLDRAGSVVVGVFDLAGRRVADLHYGLLDEGDHQWVWNGMNDSGVPQSGGVYFCRAEGQGWSTSTKLVLVP